MAVAIVVGIMALGAAFMAFFLVCLVGESLKKTRRSGY
jgi:hypothetical protein